MCSEGAASCGPEEALEGPHAADLDSHRVSFPAPRSRQAGKFGEWLSVIPSMTAAATLQGKIHNGHRWLGHVLGGTPGGPLVDTVGRAGGGPHHHHQTCHQKYRSLLHFAFPQALPTQPRNCRCKHNAGTDVIPTRQLSRPASSKSSCLGFRFSGTGSNLPGLAVAFPSQYLTTKSIEIWHLPFLNSPMRMTHWSRISMPGPWKSTTPSTMRPIPTT